MPIAEATADHGVNLKFVPPSGVSLPSCVISMPAPNAPPMFMFVIATPSVLSTASMEPAAPLGPTMRTSHQGR